MAASRTRIPKFRSEKEEAEWWDAHPEVITELFLKAKKEGKIVLPQLEMEEAFSR